MNSEQLINAARIGAILGGCTCQPDIVIVNEGGDVHRAVITHASSCKLTEARSIGGDR